MYWWIIVFWVVFSEVDTVGLCSLSPVLFMERAHLLLAPISGLA